MAKYITLMNWTDQGVKSVKDSPKRLDAAHALAKKMGCEMTKFYMTIGTYDLVAIFNAPDDETMAKLALSIAATGNIRTTTLKAFSEPSYRTIVAGLA
ncbi:MAG: GYD domain-containing protein [Alphaproteobacteria bacterium]|nr:GYD domain-containing protein [Alphaproteobacteria bacterium]